MNHPSKVKAVDVDFFYGDFHALKKISLDFAVRQVTALIGPSGCGKSTFIRCLNRLNDLIPNTRVDGKILLGDEDIYAPDVDVVNLRRRIGMVFQKPNPFPKSIYENIAYAPIIHGMVKKGKQADDLVEDCLRKAGLWEEVSDRLSEPGTALSGGQQQRLCIARAIALAPEVLLMDEPCSALDPVSTQTIEELIRGLKTKYTIIVVTHNMQQASRISEITAFFYLGELIEVNPTTKVFSKPDRKQTEEYITGRFG